MADVFPPVRIRAYVKLLNEAPASLGGGESTIDMVIAMKSIKIMFGERLRNLREIKDMTQETASMELAISRGMLSNYELGKRELDYAMLCRLADYYQVTTDYLLGITSLPQNKDI